MNIKHPSISVVIIGLNVERCIKECISSVFNADYFNELLEIIYVDGGSNDTSVALAKSFECVKIIELKDLHPTPGKGRNAGYKAAQHKLIQFLDADTTMKSGWLKTAVPYMKDDIGAVTGKVIERYPEKNIYHLINNIEWNISAGKDGYRFEDGPTKTFGGIVLIRKDALVRVNGYDESLVAGEDPDLSYRVRQAGWKIYRINTDMVHHDINMNTFRQYFKRSFRSGHAYAEIALRYITQKEKYFTRQLFRIILSSTLPMFIFIFFLILNRGLTGLILAMLLLFRPLIKVLLIKKGYNLNTSKALLYGLHLSFAVYPQFLGVLRYFISSITGFRLQNRGYKPDVSK
jgi:cellulose synthase/poly-beta-1,6-N-acetylglucosamine synthase-like glycosyltransferase